jgi:hypothetical protein
MGVMTSLWKKKGDREDMNYQRSITVSSTIGMIIEDILDDRIREKIHFTQAQGGGEKGCATSDHIFCLKAVIMLALKERKKTYVTFFDVKKAFDHADMNDMLVLL